jgi:hypothetical protein
MPFTLMKEATYRSDFGIVEVGIETLPSGRFVPLVTHRFADGTLLRRHQFAEIFATQALARRSPATKSNGHSSKAARDFGWKAAFRIACCG